MNAPSKSSAKPARRQAAASRAGSAARGSAATLASQAKIVETAQTLEAEEIIRSAELEEAPAAVSSPAGLRIRDADAPGEASEIAPAPVASNKPRISSGARIRENRAYQRVQKIKPVKMVVPASDEMGYKKLFTKFEDAFLSADIKMIGECLSPAFQWNLPNGQNIYGKAEALAEMERRFAMPNGPKFSKALWKFKGRTVIQTYKVEFLGPDGKWRKSKGMDLYKIRDGLIARKDAYWKMVP
jgi:nuclear transport factor 2 (NTF2) superfamily protein